LAMVAGMLWTWRRRPIMARYLLSVGWVSAALIVSLIGASILGFTHPLAELLFASGALLVMCSPLIYSLELKPRQVRSEVVVA